jgi:hypothetical protein
MGIPGFCINREDLVVGSRNKHHAVVHDGCRFMNSCSPPVSMPHTGFSFRDIARIDLVERAEAQPS